jgi:triosephosphate isomerase
VAERRPLVSGNWKMNHTHYEAIQFVQTLAALLRAAPVPAERDLSVHPAFTALRSVQTALESDGVPVALGAQNCHDQENGAFTGEVTVRRRDRRDRARQSRRSPGAVHDTDRLRWRDH